jgi:aryl-alcohol dehydrogenase-like predicted oxidoreductase
MALPTRPLGTSGMHITTVGYGAWAIGVGAALAGLPEPDRPYVFTKCGLIGDPADPMRPARADARRIRWEVEHSLRRLRAEAVATTGAGSGPAPPPVTVP